MNVAIKTTFWVVTFGTVGYALFKVSKPSDELLKEYDQGSKHTDTRRQVSQAISILKQASEPNSEVNKKIDDILRGKK